jgi:hypothetical protein
MEEALFWELFSGVLFEIREQLLAEKGKRECPT